MSYGYIGSMKTQPGRRDEVVAILISGLDRLKEMGCTEYTVGASVTDEVTIWTSEVWDDKTHHDATLQLPEVKEAIAQAMPMLTGEFTYIETRVQGRIDR